MINATIRDIPTDIEAAKRLELRQVETELAKAFCRYSVPHSWILDTAELLARYEQLSGKKYVPKFEEDSIV